MAASLELIELIPHLAWIADGDGQIEWLNRRFYEFTGVASDWDPRRWAEVLHPDDAPRAAAAWSAARSSESAGELACRVRRHDGQYRWHLCRAVALRDGDGPLTRWLGTATDIDAQKQVEEAQARAIDLGEQLIGVIGHDLRNPLNTIVMAATLLRRRALGPDESKWLSRISAAAGRMTRMIAQLTDLTHVHLGGRLRLDREHVDVREPLERVVKELQAIHPDRPLRVEVEGEPIGQLDEQRIEQLLSDLIGNALEHGAHAAPVTVQLRANGDGLRLTVHSSGAIAPERLPILFQPFGARRNGSLGLGLFISDQIARAHGGSIQVRSTDDAGTTFDVELPL